MKEGVQKLHDVIYGRPLVTYQNNILLMMKLSNSFQEINFSWNLKVLEFYQKSVFFLRIFFWKTLNQSHTWFQFQNDKMKLSSKENVEHKISGKTRTLSKNLYFLHMCVRKISRQADCSCQNYRAIKTISVISKHLWTYAKTVTDRTWDITLKTGGQI